MPAKRRSFAAVVRAAEGSLRAARVGHVFVGGLAVAAFGVPRTTTDVDLIVDYREQDAPRLAESFRRRGFQISAGDLRDAHAEGAHCPIHDTHFAFRVDIAAATRPRARDAIRHSLRVRWRGSTLPIADPERTIVMKLVSGSDQDVEDALGILVRQRGRLKARRMREFAGGQGVLKALQALERKAAR